MANVGEAGKGRQMGRIVTKEEFKTEIRPLLKAEKKVVALCHGVFDLVHPGHILHFEQARGMGDVLVVSVTMAQYVRKGPGRPYFNDEMRLKFLSAIACIDYVLLSEGYTVDDVIEAVEPDFYVKGSEYADENADITGKIREERELVERYGGQIRFTGGQTFSSTKLINTAMTGLSEEVRRYMEDFRGRHSMEEILGYAQKAEKLKILVVGDVIVDRYSYCNVQGLMSKDMGYSARLRSTEEYLGGAVAVARHLASFSEDVTLMSVIGDEEDMRLKLFDGVGGRIRLELVCSAEFPTIVKHRYLSRNAKREEYRKIFAVTNIPEKVRFDGGALGRFKERLCEKIEAYDVVFLCDFGNGLVDGEVIDVIQKKAKYLVLNCQTNSSNHGLNIITKYTRADAFTLDQGELKLAYPVLADDEDGALKELCRHLGCGMGWLTRGALGASGVRGDEIGTCPAFTLTVKDTVGAGDAFYAVAGIFAAAGAPVEVGTFAGNIGGALGANIIGNKEAVEKVNVLKYANTLMNV